MHVVADEMNIQEGAAGDFTTQPATHTHTPTTRSPRMRHLMNYRDVQAQNNCLSTFTAVSGGKGQCLLKVNIDLKIYSPSIYRTNLVRYGHEQKTESSYNNVVKYLASHWNTM